MFCQFYDGDSVYHKLLCQNDAPWYQITTKNKMEFPFAINSLLTDTITKLDSSVTPARRNADGFVILFLSCVHMHTYYY